MHPDPAFALDEEAARRIVAFAHVFVVRPDRPVVVHAPVEMDGPNALVFHVARRNHALPIAEGACALASFAAPGSYVSPDWYVADQQVPTWNYVAVEAEGRLAAIDDAALARHLDALSHVHEARLAPKPPWTSDKMEPRRLDAMRAAIVGFRLDVTAWRGTAKLSQNKPAADVMGVVAGLRSAGDLPMAERVRHANRDRLHG